jgi:hypothetical protein
VVLLFAAPHHTIPCSGNVRIYPTYLQFKCGLRPTTARQAMQTRAIRQIWRIIAGDVIKATHYDTAPHCSSALRPAADPMPFLDRSNSMCCWNATRLGLTLHGTWASFGQAYSLPGTPTPVAGLPLLDLTRVYASSDKRLEALRRDGHRHSKRRRHIMACD